jgi:iron complex transport system substrate-binding protein
MKNIFRTIMPLLIFSLILAACSSIHAPTESPSITLTDGLGRVVTLASPAQKIVSLAPSNTEILFAVGAGAQVIGRDEFSDYPLDAKNLSSVGGSMGNYDMEKITSLQPDLVLAASLNTPEQVKSLEQLGLTVFYLANPADLNSLYTNLEIVGQLTGHVQDSSLLVDSLKARVDVVTTKLATVMEIPLVYYELDATDPAKPWTPGPNTFLTQLIRLAGGKSIGESLTSDYAQIGLETLLTQSPDIILLGDAAYGTTAEQVALRAGWGDLKAVKDKKIFAFDDNLVSRPGPRLVDGLETLAKLLHPEIFK